MIAPASIISYLASDNYESRTGKISSPKTEALVHVDATVGLK